MWKVALIILCTLSFSTQDAHAQLFRLTNETLVHDGEEREYLLYRPRLWRLMRGDRPLVLVFHGGGGTHRQMMRGIRESLHGLADEHGFYVAYPNAIDKTWDFGLDDISQQLGREIDDLGFVQAVVDEVADEHRIDTNRVFATGISRGGMMSYALACFRPSLVRAVVPLAMSLPEAFVEGCTSGSPVPLLIINGTEDPIVPYNGGQIVVLGQERGAVTSTDQTIRIWRTRNQCKDEASAIPLPNPEDDGTHAERVAYNDCVSGAPVHLIRVGAAATRGRADLSTSRLASLGA